MREHQTPDGVYLGAFGFVENLAAGGTEEAEFLLAPSLDQATTAAILRSVHKAYAAAGKSQAETLSVNLSQNRVQRAQQALEGIRRGLTLPDLLGAQIERALRVYDLQHYIDDFRAAAPMTEGKMGQDDTTSQAKTRDMVDGLALYEKWHSDSFPVAIDSNDRSKLENVFKDIDQTLDAIHDVLLAEGIHHLVHGRPDRAAAALDAMSRGAPPPDPDVIRTPRTETGAAHRLLLLFGDQDEPQTPQGWQVTPRPLLSTGALPPLPYFHWPLQPFEPPLEIIDVDLTAVFAMPLGGGLSPLDSGDDADSNLQKMDIEPVRHLAEPYLNVWAGEMLPAPERIGCRGEFQWHEDYACKVGSFTLSPSTKTITIEGLGFQPDVVLFSVLQPVAQASTSGIIWAQGVFRREAGAEPQQQSAIACLVDDGGDIRTHAHDGAALALHHAAGRTEGRVTSTSADGFDLQFQEVNLPEKIVISYRAFKLTDPTALRIGHFQTRGESETSPLGDLLGSVRDGITDLAGSLSDISGLDILPDPAAETHDVTFDPGFRPDHILFFASSAVHQTGADRSSGAASLSWGEVVGRGDRLEQQSFGVTLDLRPDNASPAVHVHDDRVLHVAASDVTQQVRVESVTAPDDLTAQASMRLRMTPGASGPSLWITYVAVESPVTEQGPQRPRLGHIDLPQDDGDHMSVDVGFRPQLVEVFITASDADRANALGISFGYASGAGRQQAATIRIEPDAHQAGLVRDQLVALTSRNSSGVSMQTEMRVSAFTATGFHLQLMRAAHPGARLYYRAYPALPDGQAFQVPVDVTLNDLRLKPLDALALSQRSGEAADSQLERRIGYYAFRHVQNHRPSVPPDAVLDLHFRELPRSRQADVTLAEYIEAAATLHDVINDARPADQRDFAAPGTAPGPGYLPNNNVQTGSAQRLADRLRCHSIEVENTDLLMLPAAQDTVTLGVSWPEGKSVLVTLRTYSDAVRYPDQHARASVNQQQVAAQFDLSAMPPGTTFSITLVLETDAIDLSDAVREVLDQSQIEQQIEMLESLLDERMISGGARPLLEHYDTLTEDRRLAFWLVQPRDVRLEILEFFDRDDLLRRILEPNPLAAKMIVGRVIASADHAPLWQDFERHLADGLVYVPLVLRLAHIIGQLDEPGSPGAALHAAIQATSHGRYRDEMDLMRHIRAVMRTSSYPVFTQADYDAAEALEALLTLTLPAVRRALDSVVEPLARLGLTQLVNVAGDPKRPDLARFLRTEDAELNTLYPKRAEGEVRARLERLLAQTPIESIPSEWAAYSPLFRRFLAQYADAEKLASALEAALAYPARLFVALEDAVSDPASLIHDVHDLLHHPVEPDRADALAGSVKRFFEALALPDVQDALQAFVDDPSRLGSDTGDVISLLTGLIRHIARQQSAQNVQDELIAAVQPAMTTAQRELRRVLRVTRYPDPAESFRAGVLETIRHGLLRASYFGVYGSTPASAAGRSSEHERILVQQVQRVSAELDKRYRASRELRPGSRREHVTVEDQRKRIQAMLGENFMVLPVFALDNYADVSDTFAASGSLLGRDTYAPATWLQRISRIREHPARFQLARTYSSALSMAREPCVRRNLVAGQIGTTQPQWLGRDGVSPQGGEVVFGAAFASRHDSKHPLPPASYAGQPVLAGLFIDSWVENVPARDETIGVGIHYPDPDARAPHSLLLAVPPAWHTTDQETWTYDDKIAVWTTAALTRCVEETMDWMQLRPVDLVALQDMGHLLPALLLPHYDAVGSDSAILPPTASIDLNQFEWWD